MPGGYSEIDPATTPGSPNNIRVADDDIVTPEGDQAKAQRIKAGFGADGEYQDVSVATPMPVAAATARNTRGAVTAVAVDATATLVTFVADAAWKLRGFIARGDTDARYFVQYDGVTQYARATNLASPNANLVLPSADAVAANTTVTLKVTNRGAGVADFEGTLLGE